MRLPTCKLRRYNKFPISIYRWENTVKTRYIGSGLKHPRVGLRQACGDLRDDVILYFGVSPLPRSVVHGWMSIFCWYMYMIENIGENSIYIEKSRYGDIFSMAIPAISADWNIVKKRYTEIPTELTLLAHLDGHADSKPWTIWISRTLVGRYGIFSDALVQRLLWGTSHPK